MRNLTFVAALALIGVQAAGADYSGTWIAERGETTYVQLELSVTNGALTGRLGLGDVQVDASGDVAGAQPVRALTPLVGLELRDGRLVLARPDGDDIDHFEMRLLGNDAAELLFKPTTADIRDLTDSRVPLPKAFRLKKVCTIARLSGYAIEPPVEPMLAKLATELPADGAFLYEPKWDGFRAIVFRGAADVFIQSRDLKPLDRYFPELHDLLFEQLPPGCVLDGEIVIATPRGLDFDALQLRLHPAASRVAKLAQASPAEFVAFDLLAVDGRDVRGAPQHERRVLLEQLLANTATPIHLTPMTRDRLVAAEWLSRFEGAGLDGVIAKPEDGVYEPGKRAMIKIKHARTADCVVAGFRWHKNGKGTLVGSLLLGLYDDGGGLHHVGVTSSFTMARRKELAAELEPLRERAMEEHPWREWAEAYGGDTTRMPGGQSRWSAGKDLSWEPLRIERVCEVKYDHMQGPRFRHGAVFQRWRFDKQPKDCRYDQLEVTAPYELSKVFGAR